MKRRGGGYKQCTSRPGRGEGGGGKGVENIVGTEKKMMLALTRSVVMSQSRNGLSTDTPRLVW